MGSAEEVVAALTDTEPRGPDWSWHRGCTSTRSWQGSGWRLGSCCSLDKAPRKSLRFRAGASLSEYSEYGAPNGGEPPRIGNPSVSPSAWRVESAASATILPPRSTTRPRAPQVGRSGRQHPHATSAHDVAVPACETTLSLVSISRHLWQMVIMDWGGSLRPRRC